MATNYDFYCEFCNNRETITQPMIAEAPQRPTCRYCGVLMTRVWSSPPIIFKGAGFYKTGG